LKHPEFLLVPVLMFSDYVLTIAGARLRDSGYASHFRTPHYEMNPLWQRTVARMRWLNPRHLVLTFFLTSIFFAIGAILPPDDPSLPFLFGFVLGVFGMINGRHLGNLATFARIKRHPGEITGAVTIDHEFALRRSMFQLFATLLPLLLLAVFVPQPLTFGACAGVAMMVLVHFIWIGRSDARWPDGAVARRPL
jgi:hypothetical protein